MHLRRWLGKDIELALKQHVRASMNGHAFSNETSFLLNAYLERKELAELGYTSYAEKEDDLVLEAFLIIKRQVALIQEEKRKQKNGK